MQILLLHTKRYFQSVFLSLQTRRSTQKYGYQEARFKTYDELDSKLKTEEKKTNIYKFVITREMKANYLN